jgi:hypothetical protein
MALGKDKNSTELDIANGVKCLIASRKVCIRDLFLLRTTVELENSRIVVDLIDSERQIEPAHCLAAGHADESLGYTRTNR